MHSLNGLYSELSVEVVADLELQNEVEICGIRVDKTNFINIYSLVAVDDTGKVYTALVRKIGSSFEKLCKFTEVTKNA